MKKTLMLSAVLGAGESRRIEIEIPRERLRRRLPGIGWADVGGTAELRVGASSRDIRASAPLAL